MERHRELQLRKALDEVWLTGSTTIRWDEFYLWMGVKRITKKPWRDVRRVWEELCLEQEPESKVVPLKAVILDYAVVFRIDTDPAKTYLVEDLGDGR